MKAKRIAVLCLTALLVGLLGWCLLAGVGDLKTRAILLAGSLLGAIFAARGSLPDGLLHHSAGSLTADDDPANLSPRVYLPILLGVLTIASLALAVGLAAL